MRLVALTALLACFTAEASAESTLCRRWDPAEKIGAIDPVVLQEASGLAASRTYPSRLYHHNDSGMGSRFFVTDGAGGSLRTVVMPGYPAVDMEDMALGPCGDDRTCLVLGDIGDNGSIRKSISFIFIPEKEIFAATEKPLRIVYARYPDGAHNAEGFAFHPNGDLFLLTKVSRDSAQVFRLTREQLNVADGSVQTFAEVGRIDIPAMMAARGGGDGSAQVTALDISPDGRRVLVLTYQGAVEIEVDLSTPLPSQADWREGENFRRIQLTRLVQMEAVAYAPDGRSFFYDSETPIGSESILYQVRCASWPGEQ